MPESGLFKSGDAFEPVGVNRRAGSYIVLDEPIESDAPEIRDDLRPYASWGLSPFRYRDNDEGRFPGFQSTASLQTCLSPANPRIVTSTSPRSGSHSKFTIARRNLWSIIHPVSNIPVRAGAAREALRSHAYRWSSGMRPRTKPSEGTSCCEEPSLPSEIPDAYSEPTANAPAQSIHEHSGSRTAGTQNRPANGSKTGTPRTRLRWRTVTGIRADPLHYPLGVAATTR